MNALRIVAIWLSVALLFTVFLWPDIASRIERLQQERERQARLKRLRERAACANRIIEEEKARERSRFDHEMELRARGVLARLDLEVPISISRFVVEPDEDARPWLLDPPEAA